MLWKLNAAFPSVIWQVYDWYLQPNAGYYFMQNACEPLHIQLNYNDYQVAVINRTYDARKKLGAEVKVFSFDGKVLYDKSLKVKIDAEEALKVLSLDKVISKNEEIIFVVLKLRDENGAEISSNTYWLAKEDDFTNLTGLPKAQLKSEVIEKDTKSEELLWKVKVTNTSDKLAFFIRGQFMIDGQELQPTYWSKNYFSLAPGDFREIVVKVPDYLIGEDSPEIQISGWNVDEGQILID